MKADIVIKNYRCFSSAFPAVLKVREGLSGFVGVNNAGKSTLLKFFYELRKLFGEFSTVNALSTLLGGSDLPLALPAEVLDREEIFFNGNSEDIEIDLVIPNPTGDKALTVSRAVISIGREKPDRFTAQFFTGQGRLSPALVNGPFNLEDDLMSRVNPVETRVVADFAQLMNGLRSLSQTYYIPGFRHITAFSPSDGLKSYYDIGVGRPFIDNWHGLQTGNSVSGRARIHKLVDEIRTLFGFGELQINASLNNQTLQLLIDGKPFNLQDLGAGLAQFILVLGNAAFQTPSFILIDEPELNLHPALQVKFLMKLAGYATDGVLFSTHNIGLARSTAENVYSVVPQPGGSKISDMAETPLLPELLGELNYEGYRPLGFNKLLLVEGRTSFKVFVEFLRMFNKDDQFLVVPMGDLINRRSREELQEVTRICPQTFAVIDSEKEAAAAPVEEGRRIFAENCRELGIDCLVIQYRAIENYLPDHAVKAGAGTQYTALGPFEGRKVRPLWSKAENWKIVRKMSRADLEQTDLGQFLSRI
jgi:putative AbiEii toxin of type IV toxin-antitoxin system